jgi:hypothetical protein
LATAEVIKKMLMDSGVPADRITVNGEGVDLNEFHPDVDSSKARHEFNIQASDRVIVNIEMMRGDKGQEYYLITWRQLKG